MQIIPAIDILDSQLVRLTKGDPSTKESYKTSNPAEAAEEWSQRGAELIHIIDLDAALGKSPNTEMILSIAEEIDTPIQVGGGIRSIETAEKLLDGGVQRIILGSMPIKEPETARKILDKYGSDRVIIALDHKNGNLMVQGWQQSTERRLGESLEAFTGQGYEWFLVTDINQDGTLDGPDCKTYTEISGNGRIIASGGVGSIEDILKLKKTGVEAAVIGKALYLNQFSLEEAMEAAKC